MTISGGSIIKSLGEETVVLAFGGHIGNDDIRMNRHIRWIYVLTLSGIVIWIGLIFAAPYLANQESIWGKGIYMMFSPLCHQLKSRCFMMFGRPLAVCARCLGIYFGFLMGTLAFPLIKGTKISALPDKRYLLGVTIPILLDTLGNLLHIWMTPSWLRFLFGLIWGGILPFYFIAGIADFFQQRRSPQPKK